MFKSFKLLVLTSILGQEKNKKVGRLHLVAFNQCGNGQHGWSFFSHAKKFRKASKHKRNGLHAESS